MTTPRSQSDPYTRHGYVHWLGLKPQETPDLLKLIGEGLPFKSFEHFKMVITQVPRDELLTWIQITSRTLARRKEKGRLRPDESDRLLRASRIFAKVVDLFEGDVVKAQLWLLSPKRALGGETPLRYAATDPGTAELEDVIGRIEFGIPL